MGITSWLKSHLWIVLPIVLVGGGISYWATAMQPPRVARAVPKQIEQSVTTTTIPPTTTLPRKIVLPIKPHKSIIVPSHTVHVPTTTTSPPVVIHPSVPRKETPPRTTIPPSPTTTLPLRPPATVPPSYSQPNQCVGPYPPYPCDGYWIPSQT